MQVIDRDTLTNKAEILYQHTESGKIIPWSAVRVCEINNIKTVDAEPIRHGHWYRDPTNENYFCCSVCDGANGLWHQFADCTYKFCPWCGAKMDGGK